MQCFRVAPFARQMFWLLCICLFSTACVGTGQSETLASDESASVVLNNIKVISLDGHMAWHVLAADLDNDGKQTIIAGTYDGLVVNVNAQTGVKLWTYDTGSGAAITDLDTGELYGLSNGRKQIVAASADGTVHVIQANGTGFKRQLNGGPVVQAKIARFDGLVTAPATIVAATTSKQLIALTTGLVNKGLSALNNYPLILRTGTFLGGPVEQAFVMTTTGAQGVFSLQLHGFDGSKFITHSLLGQAAYYPFAPPTSQLGFETIAADLDGDGRDDLISPYGTSYYDSTKLDSFPGWTFDNEKWVNTRGVKFDIESARAGFPQTNISYTYRTERLATGDMLPAETGLETLVIHGPDFSLFRGNGTLITSFQMGNPLSTKANELDPSSVAQPRGFTDVAYVPADSAAAARVVFSSSPSGDDNLYVLSFGANWATELKNLPAVLSAPGTKGVDERTQLNLKELSAAAITWNAGAAPSAAGQMGPYPITVFAQQLKPSVPVATAAQWTIDVINKYKARYSLTEYPKIEFVAEVLAPIQGASTSYGGGWAKDQRYVNKTTLDYDVTYAQLATYAQTLKTAKIKFWLWVGHGNQPYISDADLGQFLTDFPNCIGIMQAENEEPNSLIPYMQAVIARQLQIAKAKSRKMILREKGAYWAAITSVPEVRQVLFDGGEYADVLVPSVEQSNSRTPDLNLAARVGPWLEGYVNRWDSHVAPDWQRFNATVSNGYALSGHSAFRYLVTEAVLGASSFSPFLGLGVPRVDEGVDPFLRLLGKGIIAPPSRGNVRGIAPIAVQIRPGPAGDLSRRFITSGSNGHYMSEYDPVVDLPGTSNWWAFGQQDCYWGLAKTFDSDASTYLWNRRNQFDNHIPPTPYGLVTLLPGAPMPTSPRAKSVRWETDGDQMYRNSSGFGTTKAGQEAAKTALLADLQAAATTNATSLPVYATGDEIFSQVTQISQVDGTPSVSKYIVYLVDPGFLTPRGRNVTLHFNRGGTWSAVDRLSREGVAVSSNTSTVWVKAGAVRVIELTRTY